ncbi:MAG: protein phosphatase 2C domain-containing protein [Bacteroidota bacterium]
MKIHHISTIGTFHTNHNEDHFITAKLTARYQLLAVMDGCSMGTESHFASTLVKKLLRKISKELNFKAFAERREETATVYLKIVLEQLFHQLARLKNELLLERDEVLTTLLLGIVDVQEKAAEIIVIGDGLICCNGKLTEYEQDNQPDYLGYHLHEDFKEWFEQQTQQLSVQNIKDLSLSTDGIFTFSPFNNETTYDNIGDDKVTNYLLIDQQWMDQENMLHKKVHTLEKQYGLKPTDDLTIVRLIFDEHK